jgi:protein-S-isoprenylcysteine O-methyltransferase Ste14
MRTYDLVISACWIAFLTVWAIAALLGGASRRYSATGSLLRLLLLVAIVVAMRSGGFGASAGLRLPSNVAAAGSVIAVLGLAGAIWARLALGRNWGMPMTLREQPTLVTSGPYAYVRHPIYTGVLTMMIGTSLVYPVAGIATVIMLAYFVYSARREERDLERLFPDTYAAYKRRSKMLVPFVF